jgi:hypothetical protein
MSNIVEGEKNAAIRNGEAKTARNIPVMILFNRQR